MSTNMFMVNGIVPFLASLLLFTGPCRDDSDLWDPSLPASNWVITPEGVGPLRIGMTPDEAREALRKELIAADSTAPCYYLRPANDTAEVMFMVHDGTIARVDVRDPSITTAGGVGIGDTEEKVKKLYGSHVVVEPHKYTSGHYLIVPMAYEDTWLVFETDGAKVTNYRLGRMPEVRWVEGCS